MTADAPNGSQDERQTAPARSSKRGGRRVTRKLAVLSSTAILSVYAIGYVHTMSGAEQLAAPLQTTAATSIAAAAPSTQAISGTPAQTASAASTPQAATQAAGYRDGTYTGTGSSRHGSIEATVTISSGKIASVSISQCGTRYPCSRISQLPGAVVSQQSVRINLVSGATDSSQAFVQAVSNALAQAK